MSETAHMPRYAIYFAPAPESNLWTLGSAWLGRDAWRHCAVPGPQLANIRESSLRAITQHPRRYGFHATLKAPFHLADASSVDELLEELAQFTTRESCFALPRLKLSQVDDFLALTPAHGCARLARLERRVVTHFDCHRRPLSDAEIARRRLKPLSAMEDELLLRWGYPHVLDAFRLHFTLTDSLTGAHPAFVDHLRAEALRIFATELEAPQPFDALALFEEARPGADFEEIARLPFGKPGRVVYIVGPSGAGKDSVISWARNHLALQRDIVFAERVITRPPVDGDAERHEAMSEAMFTRMVAKDAFALQWAAHGHRYAIRKEVLNQRRLGCTVVINGSREYLPVARAKVPGLEVVHITASADALARRLAARRREDATGIAERMDRAARFQPDDMDLEICNDGSVAEAGMCLLRWLTRSPGELPEAGATLSELAAATQGDSRPASVAAQQF